MAKNPISLEEVKAYAIEFPKFYYELLQSGGDSTKLDAVLANYRKSLDVKDKATLCILIKFGTVSINAAEKKFGYL